MRARKGTIVVLTEENTYKTYRPDYLHDGTAGWRIDKEGWVYRDGICLGLLAEIDGKGVSY